jgi:DNA-binding winged helix-turn-helix (wHTH) protein/tetratricopeptide (TPR) repeat protein
MEKASRQSIIRFGDFRLDWHTRALHRGGQPVPVEPKVLELIHYLASHKGRAVAKDELAETLWPDRVISDTVISQIVRKARKAVDDDGDRQAVIATVRGFGYHFVAEIEQGPPSSGGRRVLSTAPALALAAIAMVVLALFFFVSRPAGAPESLSIAFAPLIVASESIDSETSTDGVTNLIGYALAGLPDLTVVATEVPNADDVDDPVQWLVDILGADEVIQPTATATTQGWTLKASILDRAGEQTVFEARAPTLADALAPLIRQLQGRYGLGRTEPGSLLFADGWMNETMARGIHALESGDPALALAAMSTLLELQPRHAWSRYFHASARRQLGEHQQALADLEDLIEQVNTDADPALGWNIHNSIGIVHYLLGDPAAARQHFIAAANLAERVGSLRDLAQALVSRGIMEAALGNEDESDRLYAESLEIHTRIQYQPGRAMVANSLGAKAWRSGDIEASGSWHREALNIRRQIGRRSEIAQSLLNLSTVASAKMDYDEARRLINEAILLTETQSLADMHTWAVVQLGHLQYRTGEHARARITLETGLAMAEDIGYEQARASALGGLGRLSIHDRDHALARRFLMEALDTFEQMSHVRTRILDAWLDLAELALTGDDPSEAADWLDRAGADMNASGTPDAQGSRWYQLQARLARLEGRDLDAMDLLQTAFDKARRVNNLHIRLEIGSELADLMEFLGKPEQADELRGGKTLETTEYTDNTEWD